MSEWPKITKLYLHADQDSNRDIGRVLGLSQEAISDNFRGCCYEVQLTISVNEDGSSVITHLEAQKLTNPLKAS